MNESRTKNTVKNFGIGAFTQVINIFMSFIVRTIFIKILGEEYLGINGLFTNILTVLSFAELGIGNAIIYSMYKPIAENNTEKIKGLMQLYQKAYRIIAIIVLLVGMCLIPFLNIIIKEQPQISESLSFIYFLYLLNTVISYLYTYKKSIISAHQKEYIVNKYRIFFYVLRDILQITFLISTHNFIIYLILQIICTFLENIVTSHKANKLYPYIKDNNCKPITKQEKQGIFKNVKSLVMYKFGSVILNGTDNIIISKFIGVVAVGLYSNYIMIVSAINSIIGNALLGFTASVGNLNVTGDNKQKERVFYDILFISVWIFGFSSIALSILINPFIKLWIGDGYILEYSAVIATILHFYVNGVQFAGYTYRTTSGLFVKGRVAPIIAAILNIILSIVLGQKIGITGILLSTSISRLLTTTWYDAYLVHKYEFKTSWLKFIKKYIIYILAIVCNFAICYILTKSLADGVLYFIIKGIIVAIVSNLVFACAFCKTQEFKNTIQRIKKLIKGKKYEQFENN